jgi:3-oxoacyl-[acyl-carrier-protein] synthase II
MSHSRRVALTGIGVISPLGLTAPATLEGLLQGRSGIQSVKAFDASPLSTRFAGEIVGFDAKHYLDKSQRKNMRVMARGTQLAVAAAQLAIDDSAIDKAKIDPARFGTEFGAGLLPSELYELGPASQISAAHGMVDLKAWGEKGLPVITPLWMLKYLPNMLACHVSIIHNLQGPSNTITESDVAGLLALGEAVHIIRRDQADLFLVGGADSKINALSMVRQCLFGRLSTQNEAPEKAIRPFDAQRNGAALGEGGGVLIAEEWDHAKKRGAKIYGEIAGFGAAFDRGMAGKGLVQAIRTALAQAELQPADIDFVCSHGLGSIKLDAWEARSLAAVFGTSVPVWSLKSSFGNTGAGSGTIELAVALLAARAGTIPATLNHDAPAADCPITVTRQPHAVKKPHFLKVGYTEMGQCAAVVCRVGD